MATFDRPGIVRCVIEFLQTHPRGTELNIEQAGVPAVIPVEMCYIGWQDSLTQLAMLVEPEIPN